MVCDMVLELSNLAYSDTALKFLIHRVMSLSEDAYLSHTLGSVWVMSRGCVM